MKKPRLRWLNEGEAATVCDSAAKGAGNFCVNGTLNGIRLRTISALRTNKVGDFMHTTFRVLDSRVIELEEILRLDAPALFILNEQNIEGRIVHYTADMHHGYEITIESRAPRQVDYDP